MKINGLEVKEARKRLGRSTAELAVAADMSTAWVMKLEARSSHEVNDHIAKAVAKFVGLDIKKIEVKEAVQ